MMRREARVCGSIVDRDNAKHCFAVALSSSIHRDIGFGAPGNNLSFSFLLSQCALRFTAATKAEVEVQQILELGGRGDAPIQHW
jgi:hypothetical protein